MKLTTYCNLRFQRDSKPPEIVSNIAEHSIENNSAIAYLLKWRKTTTHGSQTTAPRSLLWLIFKPIAGAQRKKKRSGIFQCHRQAAWLLSKIQNGGVHRQSVCKFEDKFSKGSFALWTLKTQLRSILKANIKLYGLLSLSVLSSIRNEIKKITTKTTQR